MRYAVVYEQTNTGYSAYIPDLPGCVATGRNREEVEQRLRKAIELHLAGLREDGLPIPEPTSLAGYLEVRDGAA
jgi:predicted RNase H-like HicB family nuclease